MADIKISELPTGTAPDGTELLESVQGGSSVSLTALQMATLARQAPYTYNIPVNAFSLLVGNQKQYLVLNPAGTLATGTITLAADPLDGDTITISTTQEITALTLAASAGDTIANAVSTLLINTSVKYIYVLAQTKWFRVG